MIKSGHPEALALFGVKKGAAVRVENFQLSATSLKLGERLSFTSDLVSTSNRSQRIVADYAVHYVKKSGERSRKVFKLSEFDLPAHGRISLQKSQRFQNFTTRIHYAGEHRLELLLNGVTAVDALFHLKLPSVKSPLNT